MALPSYQSIVKKDEKKKLPSYSDVVGKGKLPKFGEVVKPTKQPYTRLRERTTAEAGERIKRGEATTLDALLSGLLTGVTFGAGSEKVRETMPEHKIAATIGELGGSILPVGRLYKGAGLLTKPIKSGIGKIATTGALTGAGLGAGKATLEQKPLKEIGKEAAIYGALGAVGDPLLEKGLLPLAKKGIERTAPALKDFIDFTKKGKVQPKTQPKVQLEAQPKALEKIVSETPKQELTQPIVEKPSRFASETVINAEITAPEVKQALTSTEVTYKPVTNPETLAKAQRLVSENIDEAERIVNTGEMNADTFATAQELVRKAQNEGRFEHAVKLVSELSERASTAGQAVQSLSMWGRLTPEGMLRYAQNIRNKAIKNKIKIPKNIPPKLAKEINDLMTQANKLPDGREKSIIVAKALDKIAAQVPASFAQKISTLQTMAQLLNPKTAIRNLVGNLGFATTEQVTDVVATLLDIPISKLTGKRTKLLPSLKVQAEGFKKGWELGLEDALLGIDTGNLATRFDIPTQRVFRKGVLGALEKAMNIELKATDRAFYNAAYEKSLQEQMQIAGASEPTLDMIEVAAQDGLYRTFQDKNLLSNLFTSLKKTLNKIGIGDNETRFGLGDMILKYPKTPANLLARGFDYSPIGFVETIFRLAKDLKKNPAIAQKNFVEGISRSAVGTAGLVGVGATLHKLGIITGRREEDIDIQATKQAVGLNDYQINLSALKRFMFSGFNPEKTKLQEDDTLISYDWFQPNSIAIAMGADFDKNNGDAKSLLTGLVTAIETGTSTLVEQPLLTGVTRLFQYGDLGQGLTETLKGIPASFTPTLLSQIGYIIDDQAKSVYSPDTLQEGLNLAKRRIPGLSQTLEPQINVLGQERQFYQPENMLGRILNTFFNPAIISEFKPTPGSQLVLDLAEQGQTIQAPRRQRYYITYKGERIDLTPQEYTELSKYVGQEVSKRFDELAKNDRFVNQPPEKQAKLLQRILTEVGQQGRNRILKNR